MESMEKKYFMQRIKSIPNACENFRPSHISKMNIPFANDLKKKIKGVES